MSDHDSIDARELWGLKVIYNQVFKLFLEESTASMTDTLLNIARIRTRGGNNILSDKHCDAQYRLQHLTQ
jgi:hypothetical protein